jgi:RNA polymerase sigma factor (sigma-70 family)
MSGRPLTDGDRFDTLWAAHYRAVLAYSMRRSPEQARDITADVFLVAWRRLADVPDDALPWLLAVARNKILNHRRGARRWIAALARLSNEREQVVPDPAERSDLSRLREALASLSERDREIITLTAWDGLTATRAAAVIGVSPEAAAVRLHRARRRLAAALERSDTAPAAPTPAPAPAVEEPPR